MKKVEFEKLEKSFEEFKKDILNLIKSQNEKIEKGDHNGVTLNTIIPPSVPSESVRSYECMIYIDPAILLDVQQIEKRAKEVAKFIKPIMENYNLIGMTIKQKNKI